MPAKIKIIFAIELIQVVNFAALVGVPNKIIINTSNISSATKMSTV